MGGRLVSVDDAEAEIRQTIIHVGGGLKWAKVPAGVWMEMSEGIRHDAVSPDDIFVGRSGLRVLTPAEVERAERGEGPEVPCPCGGVGCRDVADGALHQCGGPSEACAVPGCQECDAPVVAGPVATEDIFMPMPPPGGVVVISSPQAPAGLTVEQAARLRDRNAMTIMVMISECATRVAVAKVVYWHDLDSDSLADSLSCLRSAHDALVNALANYISGGDPRLHWMRSEHGAGPAHTAACVAAADELERRLAQVTS